MDTGKTQMDLAHAVHKAPPQEYEGGDGHAKLHAWGEEILRVYPREQIAFDIELLYTARGAIGAYRRGVWERATNAHGRELIQEIAYTPEGQRLYPPYRGLFNIDGEPPIGW